MRRFAAGLFCALLLLVATHREVNGSERLQPSDCPREPRVIVVNQDGTGDATTIQAGAELAIAPVEGGASTLVVMPGYYDESVTLPLVDYPWVTIVCPGGPERTRVRRLEFADSHGMPVGWGWTTTGISVVEPVYMKGVTADGNFRNCRFEGGYIAHMERSWPNLVNCEFYGRTELIGYLGTALDSLVFHGATLYVKASEHGSLTLRNCIFLGPVDTALIVSPFGNSPTHIVNSTFSGVRYAVVVQPRVYASMEAITVDHCRFEATETAISYDYDGPVDGPPLDYWGLGLSVTRSEFIGGRESIRWNSYVTGPVYMDSVTITDPKGDAVFARLAKPSAIQNVSVRNAGGRGIVLRPEAKRVEVTIHGCSIDKSGGGGIVLEDPAGWLTRLTVTNNVVTSSGGNGIHLMSAAPVQEQRAIGKVMLNTSLLNTADGLLLDFADPAKVAAHHNLAAGNDGAGLRTHGLAADSVRHNDSWSNAAGNYAGDPVSTDNLSADPGLCDALAGDWHVQTGSPCAPSGPYGQIGVLGVGCDASRVEAEIEGAHPVNTGSNAKLRLAVFGHRLFDPASMDPATVLLAGVQAESRAVTDANGDGFEDLILAFRARGMTAAGSPTDSIFSAELDGGTRVYGRVAMRRVPAPRADAGVQLQEERFAIDVVRSAVLGRTVRASITTRAGSPAALDLYDVAGRRVAGQSLSSRGGMQVVELVPAGGLRNGIYFLRLAQMQEQLIEKVVILR